MNLVPLLHERDSKVLVLSVATRFARKLLPGEKTVELRRRFPQIKERAQLSLLYSSREERSIVAWCRISSSEQFDLEVLWERFRDEIAITRNEFDVYFSGLSSGYAVRFSQIHKLSRPIPLSILQSKWSFTPPQSYCYVSFAFFDSVSESGA